MAKKFSLLLAAVAVLAFAIPSMASATVATLPAGTVAPVGTQITGTGSDIILHSSLLGTITCKTLNLNGEITKNKENIVEGKGENVSPTQSGCVNGAKEVKVTKVELTNLFSETTGTGTVSFKATVDIGSELVCTFTGTKVPGTYALPSSSVLKFSEAGNIVSSPAACGTTKLTGEFTLEKTGTSTALILE
jgi:hypothetical protein